MFQEKKCTISIFGLGYVGTVAAACLASEGYRVIGIDPNPVKVDLITQGRSPIVEADVDRLITQATADQCLTASQLVREGVLNADILMICVGTPSQSNGSLDTHYVQQVCEEIGSLLPQHSGYPIIVIRSTLLPGTMHNMVIPTLEKSSNLVAGKDFGVCNNPEFLREGTAVADYRDPPKTVIGASDSRSADILASIYKNLTAPLIITDIQTAEMAKYADNAWHALKIGFANEIGRLSKALTLDSHKVMDIFCQDLKLNISKAYLKPGYAFGGSCLPKDVRALTYQGKSLDVQLPILDAILPSNDQHIEQTIRLIRRCNVKRIGILGLSFKEGTDDLRESPMVELIERLIGKGYDIKLIDRNVKLASLMGANRDYILNHIPHIARLMVDDLNEICAHAELVVLGHKCPEFESIFPLLSAQQQVVDLVKAQNISAIAGHYHGLCW
jgi:GDP-mannose 6-dehydrogenase